MIFNGQAFQLQELKDGFVELVFDLQGDSVNKFNTMALDELEQAVGHLERRAGIRGMLLRSGKEVFIVGADVSEFGGVFSQGASQIEQYVTKTNVLFSRIEDLPFPTVAAINGYCLGGGMELALACDFRVLSTQAKIGLPETKLGIIPGWGGTVRLPRLAGLDVAVEWIASGKEQKAQTALIAGVADGVVEPQLLIQAALKVLQQAVQGKLLFEPRRKQKKAPLQLNDTEALLAFESSKAFIRGQAGRHYPAPVAAIKAMQESAKLSRDDALKVETKYFTELAQTDVAHNLVGLFLSDQLVAKKAKKLAKAANKKVERAAVLGAGIMGGGIAYQSAYKGTPIKMKDIAQAGLDLGLAEASKLLNKQVVRGRIDAQRMAVVLNNIHPSLSYDSFDEVDVVVEAVVENSKN